MWTTDAQHADFQELLIRTGEDGTRHKGLTWIIADMRAPGIDIRPVRTMLGDEHVNMVFYDDVRIPLSNVVGEVDQGWSTAMATLSFERGLGFIGDQLELYERVSRAIALAAKTRLEDGTLALNDAGIAQRLASIKADCMAIRAMTLADIAETDRTGMPGPKGSMMKLMVTQTHKALSEVASEILGWDFMEFDGDRAAHPWTYEYLWSWIFSISGGTSEIQREITADRVLALPRSR
jgi:alkylation response protein AidB-like acyl-CoA dehydrogenase